jgi:ferritin-like metal-binding protein YciE
MSSSTMKGKLVQYFNEALAMENAATDRIQSRINETPVEQTKQQLHYHLEQTFQQQERLRDIITKLGGDPTTMKAGNEDRIDIEARKARFSMDDHTS